MGDWYTTGTLSNPDGSVDVAYCDDCGTILAMETVEENESCPRCGHPDEGGA